MSFYDRAARKFVDYDLSRRAARGDRSAVPVTQFASFKNGQVLVYRMSTGKQFSRPPLGLEQREARHQELGDARYRERSLERVQLEEELGRFDVLLYNKDFTIVRGVEEAAVLWDALSPGDRENGSELPHGIALHAKQMRPGPGRSSAVVFSPHQRTVRIYDQAGGRLSEFESPGKGALFTAPPQLAGERGHYQSDVLLGANHLLLVDNPAKMLWKVDKTGSIIDGYDIDFVVESIHPSGGILFLLGINGELLSVKYPT